MVIPFSVWVKILFRVFPELHWRDSFQYPSKGHYLQRQEGGAGEKRAWETMKTNTNRSSCNAWLASLPSNATHAVKYVRRRCVWCHCDLSNATYQVLDSRRGLKHVNVVKLLSSGPPQRTLLCQTMSTSAVNMVFGGDSVTYKGCCCITGGMALCWLTFWHVCCCILSLLTVADTKLPSLQQL